MATNLATPGVYIEEKNAFPNSVAGIPTAIPAFVGYTEKTTRNGQSLINKAVRISSLAEYHSIFGGGVQTTFDVLPASGDEGDFEVDGTLYTLAPVNNSRFMLYDSIRLFFANGGGTCYIVSAGGYFVRDAAGKTAEPSKENKAATTGKEGVKVTTSEKSTSAIASSSNTARFNTISKKALEAAISSLISEEEPTMLVVPEAVMLSEGDCFAVQQAMLMHCGYKMRNRFAILDVYNGTQTRTYDNQDVITRFREGVGNNFLNYGAAYYPWVYTSIVDAEEINYKNINNLDVLETILSREAEMLTDNPKKAEEIKNEIRKLRNADTNIESLTQTLKVVSPTFKNLLDKVRTQLNILPPSAGMAGIYSMVDNSRGVWKAPANVGFASAIAPAVKLTHDDQEDLNITVTGKSINAIRSFIGEGTVVWGARTLDGNSQDWRYINVRRTLLYLEQSIKYAAKAYVYEPNTSNTWVLVKSMISSFLNDVWKQGGLAGITPSDAYEVLIGLGSTMTPNDILDGIMRITVKVAVTRPAEFIVITFQQKMQES